MDAHRFWRLVTILIFLISIGVCIYLVSWGVSVYAPQPKYQKGFLLTKLVFEYPINASLPISIQNPYNFSVRVWVFVAPQNASQYIVYSVVPDLNGTVLEAKETKIFTFHVTFLKSDIQEAEILIEGEKV